MRSTEIERIFEKVHIDEPNISMIDESETEGVATVTPLLRGYGTTIGNSLRRVMLSSLPGAAAISISINGGGMQVQHEFTSIPGVLEDVCEIVLNVKSIVCRLLCDGMVSGTIDVIGPADVTAAQIHADSALEIINPEQHIATVAAGANFHMELKFDHGIGYVSSSANKMKYNTDTLGELFVDSIFTPVRNVSYTVENTRVGSSMDYDKLEMHITTDGSISPSEAVVVGSQILKEHFNLITSVAGVGSVSTMMEKGEKAKIQACLDMSIDDMELSVRSYNCLRRAGIDTVADLIAKTKSEMEKVRNLGLKSLKEIEEKINDMGLSFKEEEF